VTASLLIVFREVLEAALIVGIIAAVTKGVAGRGAWITGGIAAGTVGAILVALFAGQIAEAAEGLGQEIFNASILFAAVLLLSWHNIWMAKHGREIAKHVGHIGEKVKQGAEPLYALAAVVGVAVLREGSEVVLFLYGIAAAGSGGTDMIFGSALGLAAGAALGFILYFGLLKIPLRYFFSATSWMILLLAAGMAGNGARFLAQADLLPSLGEGVWDTSWLLPENGFFGQILHVLIGYSARPSGIQIAFYAATVIGVGGLMYLTMREASKAAETAAKLAKKAAIALVLLGAAAALLSRPAHAGPDKVYSPIVQKGELELEHRGILDADHEAGFLYELGYGLTDNWFASILVEGAKQPGMPYRSEVVGFENIIQLTEPGQYFVDVGLYLEYEVAAHGGEPDMFEGKILLEKTTGRFVHTANLIFENQTGSGAAPGTFFEFAWQSRYLYRPELQFGVQGFSEFGQIGHFGPLGLQQHHAGPALFGKFRMGKKSFLVYEAAYLIGLTSATPNAFRWLLEYEHYF
jgi:FTR1 family protein